MNINLDTQFSTTVAGNTETTTTSYQTTAHKSDTGKVSRSSYTTDIADKVMDNEAYRGHGMTVDDIMQQAAGADSDTQKDFMIVMSSCVSGEDLQRMQEEGFRPGSTDVESYVSIVDKIKVTLAQAGVEVAGYTDDLDVETIEKITGSKIDANKLIDTLSEALQKRDIPVTNENIAELVSAVMEASGIEGLSEDTIKYLVINQKEPTIENIYKAQYSSADSIRQAQGYYSDNAGNYGKYYAKKAEEINWDNLKNQIESVVKQAGLDANEQTKAAAVENAKWLVASGIELNAKNLAMVTELKNVPLPMDQNEIADLCVTAMENGKAPVKADLTGEKSIALAAHEIKEEVEHISDEAIHNTAESGKEITLRNLSDAQKQINDKAQEGTQNSTQNTDNINENNNAHTQPTEDASLREIQARRQLEEIRLMMSEEANRYLLKAGFSIDTAKLSELVEALKAAEEKIKAVLFQGGSTEENVQRALIYEETLTKTKELADMPAALLGKILSKVHSSTLDRIHEAGKEFQNEFENQQNPSKNRQESASSAYETLMTEPRKDLGDKISKAFRNIDDILTDLGLEASEPNRRAVRILGYNRMEITQENIQAVKEADSQVTGVISRMTPATTLQMIREQKNPLEMTMDELDEYLNNKGKDPLEDAEKYSRFLQRLERNNAISEEEREAYIGIYRMFRQIEKSDGAVIGNIVATGAEMNFKNMLSAVRTAAAKKTDVRVDDGFGVLENVLTKGKAIDDQINAGYQPSNDAQEQNQNSESDIQKEEQYYARLSGEINEELADRTDFDNKDILTGTTQDTTIEEFADKIKANQVPQESVQKAEEKAENLKAFQQDMQKAEQTDEQIIEMLIDYGQPVSIDNIQAAFMLIFERGALFKQAAGAFDKKNADETEAKEDTDSENAVLEQADQFVENLKDANQASTSYQEIIREANKAVENMLYAAPNSQIDVKAAKALYKGLSLAGNLAREENYEVPMNIKGEITSVNLKICHNASQAGKVAVTLDTENLGKIAAEFDVAQDRVSGMVVYENQAQKPELEQLEQMINKELSADGTKQVAVSFVHAKSVDLNKFGQNMRTTQKDEKLSTAELYQTAKSFLTALKSL